MVNCDQFIYNSERHTDISVKLADTYLELSDTITDEKSVIPIQSITAIEKTSTPTVWLKILSICVGIGVFIGTALSLGITLPEVAIPSLLEFIGSVLISIGVSYLLSFGVYYAGIRYSVLSWSTIIVKTPTDTIQLLFDSEIQQSSSFTELKKNISNTTFTTD